ncbi:MAG: polysaccharide biosynthesis protein [Pseudomonadales bacterium]|nr:polysaccharide biosynthesis protein [Pseudomonadales bacterium]MBO7004784.1 polysaccharide biosynthesis protein [Pseudomonadales bacterium]
MQTVEQLIVNLPRSAKRLIAIATDFWLIPVAIWLAYCFRLDEFYRPGLQESILILLTTLVTTAMFVRLGLYRAVIRFANTEILTTVFTGVIVSVLALSFLGFLLQAELPRSVPFIYFGIAMFAVGGSRFLMKRFLRGNTKDQRKVIIYGAGSVGSQLATALIQAGGTQPIAFIDDDKRKHGSIILGLRIFGRKELEKILRAHEIDAVLLAMSNIGTSEKASVISFLATHDISVKTVPAISEIIDGKSSLTELRNVEVEDLLGRDPIPPDEALLQSAIKAKTVLITGAGGSIGGELARQAQKLSPKQLVLVDHSEIALYNIENELRGSESQTSIYTVLASVTDSRTIRHIFDSFNVDTVYHAAAYKHVPIVEANPLSGVENNVFGTQVIAEAAFSHEVHDFVLISTDKAVRPTNLMGATKRIAELVIQSLASKSRITNFSIVRFGNVLESSGSVVPLFKQQILAGGPLTVTHPEIKRYFMTIPEAVQLVIQAGAMGKDGDVFVLEMGEPVHIAKLAESMVHLLGKTLKSNQNPDGNIEIAYTGLRPGEKLFEELTIGDNVVGTDHPRITKALESYLEDSELEALLKSLEEACENCDQEKLIELFMNSVEGYTPSNELIANSNEPKVIDFQRPT